MAHFKLKLGGKTMTLSDGQYDIGRMSDCWLTLDDEMASRYHARIYVEDLVLELEDLGSRNGTYVNGERLEGRRVLSDGDRVRIGRELITVLMSEQGIDEEEADIRRTLAPGEDTRFSTVISQLVAKSLKVGKIKDAERYVSALTNQFQVARFKVDHPASIACVDCLLQMAERSGSGVWIDRLFQMMTTQRWVMDASMIDATRAALDRIPRMPGRGIREYEGCLRELEREGVTVPETLRSAIAEIADACADS